MKSVFLEAIVRIILIVVLIVAAFLGTIWMYNALPEKMMEKIFYRINVVNCKFYFLPKPDDGCEKYVK